eukprot:Sspe_Gene.7199::Locus_2439_Transcript_1_1_Confidence_1.000_Length_3663::g.7199::m.7199
MEKPEMKKVPSAPETISSHTSEGGYQVSFWRRVFLSLQSVTALLCFTAIAISVTATAILFDEASSHALSKTRETGSENLDTCFSTADSSLRLVAGELLSLSSNAAVGVIEGYLRPSVVAFKNLQYRLKHMKPGETRDRAWLHSKAYDMLVLLTSTREDGITGLGAMSKDYHISFVNDNHYGEGKVLTSTLVDYNNTYMQFGPTLPNGYPLLMDPPMIFKVPEEHHRDRDISMNLMQPNEACWSGISSIGSFLGFYLVGPYHDVSGTAQGAIFITLLTTRLDLFLASLAERTTAQTGARVRLFTSVIDTCPEKKLAAANNTEYVNKKGGLLTGVSHGSAGKELKLPDPWVNRTTTFRLPAKDFEASDERIRLIAQKIGNTEGKYHAVNASNAGTFLTINTTDGVESYFVKVSQVQDGYGLNWWLTVAVEADFVLGDVAEQQVLARQRTATTEDEVQDDVREQQGLAYIGCTLLALFVVVISVGVIAKVLSPIKQLQKEMGMVATMELDALRPNLSALYEVHMMQKSFHKMVQNLKEYRTFVPTAVLMGNASVEVLEPPLGEISLVFTDIESSTRLWERAPGGMNTALEIHNDVIRHCLSQHKGYEVKTIGDAFMVAFSSHVDAAKFCLDVQSDLVEQVWPEELELPPVPDSKRPVWSGLKVRMGLHYGEAILEENPLTGRGDYRGSNVNKAARVEGKALGGTVCVTNEMLSKIAGDLASIGSPLVVEYGEHELKGLKGTHTLHLMVPARLAARLDGCRKDASSRVPNNFHKIYASSEEGDLDRRGSMPLSRQHSGSSNTTGKGSSQEMNEVTIPVQGGGYTPGHHGLSSDDSDSVKGHAQGNSQHAVSSGATSRKVHKGTGLSLNNGTLTVAVLTLNGHEEKVSSVFERYNLMIRAATDAATQTDGVVQSVTGRSMLIVWNGSKTCRMHSSAACRFAAMLQRRTGSIIRVGLATGNMLHGNVGTQKTRFNAVYGRPLAAAQSAADYAAVIGTYCLLADCTQEKRGANWALQPVLRPVDVWQDSKDKQNLVIYELDSRKLMQQLEDAWGDAIDVSEADREVYSRAFFGAVAGNADDLQVLQHLSSQNQDDLVLKRVLNILSKANTQNSNYRCSVKFSCVPAGALSGCDDVLLYDVAKVRSPITRGDESPMSMHSRSPLRSPVADPDEPSSPP